jgi:pimeloyl-ACP methyl ester carboxylesterase
MPILDPRHVRIHRAGSGPPVLLLHGIASTRRMWDGIAALTDRFELVSYDFPGHGETEQPETPYEIDDLADQAAVILTAAGIQRAHVVASSLGGMVAQPLAAAWPARIGRLVLCDTTPALSEGKRDELLTMPGHGAAHAAMARADLMDLAEEIQVPTLVLCAADADLAMREGADFLARSIPYGQLAFVPGVVSDCVTERPDWVSRALLDFLG